jgi:hypothetical protein
LKFFNAIIKTGPILEEWGKSIALPLLKGSKQNTQDYGGIN